MSAVRHAAVVSQVTSYVRISPLIADFDAIEYSL